MAIRALIPRLSDVDLKGASLEDWQEQTISKVQDYHNQAFQERVLLTPQVCAFAKPKQETVLSWLIGVVQKVCQLNDADAEHLARKALRTQSGPTATAMDGILAVSPFARRYDDKSLWKGPTDNKKLCRLARLILNGFDSAEPIQSRTVDLSDWDGSGLLLNRLLFGDGQSRGLGVWFAWNVMMEWINHPDFIPSPGLERVFRTLLQVPVVFEAKKRGLSQDSHLLECAVKQNIKAQMQQPLNTLEWCFLMIGQHKTPMATLLSWEAPNVRKSLGQELLQIMSKFLNAYDEHSDVKAYDIATAPTAKRRRSNRGARAVTATAGGTEDTIKEDTIKVGAKRLQAMKNILSKISKTAFLRWQEHLGWVGVWKYNALQDPAAGMESLWPESQLPKERRPNELEDMAREIGHKVAEQAPGNANILTRLPLFYNERLTGLQHEQIFHKGFEIFEAETLHITDLNQKLALRPTSEDWLNIRQVVEHWDRTIKLVAEKDMAPKDLKELEDTVLNTNLMDQQILDAVQGYPKMFHLGMIPDLKAYYQNELDEEKEKFEESNDRFWEANFNRFELQLEQDWRLCRLTNTGTAALADLLEWLDLKSKIELQQQSRRKSTAFLAHFFPVLSAESWQLLPGVFAVARKQEVPTTPDVVVNDANPRKLLIAKADFNTPNARDAMKLGSLAGALATMAKQVGADKVVVVCVLATRNKEENIKTDVLDHCMHLLSWKSCWSRAQDLWDSFHKF